MRNRLAILFCVLPAALLAQEPLSAIDWLTIPPAGTRAGQVWLEPPVTENGAGVTIEVTPLEAAAHPVGLVPAHVTGLPTDMWVASETGDLIRLLKAARIDGAPAMQTLLYTLLLAETLPPGGRNSADRFLMARLDRLADLGAVEPAQAMVETVGPDASPARFARWFDATLLTGDEDNSCALLNRAPHLDTDYGARMFCSLRKGDWSAAAVMLDAARALSLMPQEKLFLLDRFLNPDLYDGAPPLPLPENPDPLTFRLFESIGEPVPTAPLPRRFAVADLRDIAGWKAQLEAAERLGRAGAISPNRLLGIYTDRLPAASGGVWDRVAALQRFDTALNTGSADAVAKTLPLAWNAMQAAGLETSFAAIFAARLAAQPVTDPATAALVFRIRLLSADYEAAAANAPQTPEDQYLAALARGRPPESPDALRRAIADGFADPLMPPDSLKGDLQAGRLGEAILRAIAMFDSGRKGNLADLTDALRLLRAVGLEDTARRAALQRLLLEPA